MFIHGQWFFRTYPSAWYFFPVHLGWAGVDLFFVLSGFLITGILIRTRTAENRWRSFFMRRCLRIFPLYYAVVLAIFVGVHLSWFLRDQVPAHSWKGWLVVLLYLQNWALFFNPNYWYHNIIGHFWSLAIEEQFYVIWPWIVWSVSPRTLLRLSIAGMIASLALRCALMWHFGASHWLFQFVMTPTRGEGLLMGSALAAYSAQFGTVPRRALAVMAASGAAILALIDIIDPHAFVWDSGRVYTLTVGLTGFILIYGALVGSTQYSIPYLTAALNWAWLRSFGKYSYGIYVYHHILFLFAAHAIVRAGLFPYMRIRVALPFMLLNIAAAYGIAWLSFNYFESLFLQMKDRFRPRSNVKP